MSLIANTATNCLAASKVGQPAPTLIAPLIESSGGATSSGVDFNLGSEKGKVVILHFWATWCPACKKEMPALADIYRRFHPQGVDVLGVSVDRSRDRDEVVKYMHDLPFPAAMLRETRTNGFDAPGSIPVTYVIDKKGVIRGFFDAENSPLASQTLTDLIQTLLAP